MPHHKETNVTRMDIIFVLAIVTVIFLAIGLPVLVDAGAGPTKATVADCCVERDSLTKRLHEKEMLIVLTKQQMDLYVGIVVRDPSQVKFLKGWTKRAFEITIPENQ